MSDHANTTESRLNALEVRLTHQDAQIEELSATVFEQWKVIDTLKAKLKVQTRELETLSDDLQRNDGERPPPHY